MFLRSAHRAAFWMIVAYAWAGRIIIGHPMRVIINAIREYGLANCVFDIILAVRQTMEAESMGGHRKAGAARLQIAR
jgi:hypothetical protein